MSESHISADGMKAIQQANASLDAMTKSMEKATAENTDLSEQVGSLIKVVADQQAELSKLQETVKHQGITFLKSMEAIAKMSDRQDATVERLEMVETNADAPNNAGEAKH